MNKPNKKYPLFSLRYFILVLFVFLTACDSSPDNSAANTVSIISGDVLDGPIKNGILEVRDANNKIVATSRTDERGGYSVDLPDDAKRPLIISITGGIDIVTDHPLGISLKSIITADNLTASDKNININAFSSLVVVAYQMFAENDAGDINVATNHVMQAISFGLNPNANPITTAMDKDNVADFIKANEAAIEFIRRLSVASGKSMVKTMIALSEDLSDGVIDGKAATGINPTQLTEAFAKQARIIQINIISELINNRLKITDEAGSTLVSADESAVKLNTAIKINQVDAGDEQSIENIVVTDELNQELLDAIAEVELYSDEDLASSGVSLNDDIDLEQLKKTASGIKTVSITGPSAVLEGVPLLTGVLGEIGPETYIVSIDVAPTTDTTVMLSYSGTASEGIDYTSVDSVLISAGNISATFGLTTHSDDLLEGTETMIVSISSISYSGSETIVASTTNQQVTTIINDTSSLTVSLAGPVQTIEGDSANIYMVSIDQAPTTDTVITLSYSGTATDILDYSSTESVIINANTTSSNFPLNAIEDNLLEDSETIIITIDSINHTGNETIQLSISNKEVTTEVNDVILSGFTDSSLRTCIFNMLPANEAQLLTGISYVDCGNASISNLAGLEQLIGLSQLNLASNQIVDISPVADLILLDTLDLRNNQINDLSSISNLTALSELALGNNQIIDISPVSGLTALNILTLWENEIEDISPVAGLTALTSLYLKVNQIIDISPIAGLTSLTSLYLSSNLISDISPVSGLTALSILALDSNKISDLSSLPGLSVLTNLDLGFNQIVNLAPLSDIPSLNTLKLNNNQISIVDSLSGLTNLGNLDLSFNCITDFTSLDGLSSTIIISTPQNSSCPVILSNL